MIPDQYQKFRSDAVGEPLLRKGPQADCTWPARPRFVRDLAQPLEHLPPVDRLRTLYEQDPLRISSRTEAWLCCHGYLFDRLSMSLKVLTALAADLPGMAGEELLEGRIKQVFAQTSRSMMNLDRLKALAQEPIGQPLEARFTFLHQILGIDLAHLRGACVAINALPENTRMTFHSMLVQGKGIGRYAQESGMLPHVVKSHLVRALSIVKASAQEQGDSHA